MRHRPLPAAARRLAALAAVALVVAPLAGAVPSAHDLRAERDALDARDATLARHLGRAEAALTAGRVRLDRARALQREALDGLELRLTALYVSPDPSPFVEILTGGDLDEAQAGLDLLEALSQRDLILVDDYRRATRELRAAEAGLQRRKDDLVAERARLGVERQVLSGELSTAVRRERALATEQQAATAPVLTSGSGGFAEVSAFGLPAAGDDTATTDASAALPVGATRGLPASFLEGRTLPGDAPIDAQTGTPVDSEPIAVGPVSAAPVTGNLPTFTAVASWYGPGFTRAKLASGEPYDPAAYTTASRTLRLGTLLRIGYGGRVVTVRVNDRGPYVRGRDLQLSQAAAAALGLPGMGTVTVQILPTSSAPAIRA